MRILLLADTHIGLDAPWRPRVDRRRRGPDFLQGFERALRPALAGEADLVVHGGDLLYRSRVPPRLVEQALAPLLRVAGRGVPVFLVPGNHERSRLPYPLLAAHPHLHVFHRPHTFTLVRRGVRLALSGFPFARRVGGAAFGRRLERTRWRRHAADVRLLCLHQAVEGAQVGAHDYTFRRGDDVVARAAIPAGFAALLSGHIHRGQVLNGAAAPVCYPGAVERTSFAERHETKGYLRLEVAPGPPGGRLVAWTFVPLPTRPMVVVPLEVQGLAHAPLTARLRDTLRACDPGAVVRLDVRGTPRGGAEHVLRAGAVRALAPPDLNVTVAWRDNARRRP
ncbi:MAG: metallophosphoesterase family protein [Planctomycetota bacterium]